MVTRYVTGIAHHGARPNEYRRDCDEQPHVKLSPTLQDRLAREAAERGMQPHDWAVLKLALDAEPRRIPVWCAPPAGAALAYPLLTGVLGAGPRQPWPDDSIGSRALWVLSAFGPHPWRVPKFLVRTLTKPWSSRMSPISSSRNRLAPMFGSIGQNRAAHPAGWEPSQPAVRDQRTMRASHLRK
jgi:hypothetical protein